VQRLRARSAAIITGSETVIADNPSLNVRSDQLGIAVEQIPQPKIVILDRRSRLNADMDYTVCHNPDTLFWREDNLLALLETLVSEYQCYDVLVEAGAKVAGSFIAAGLVDELVVYQAPCILGSTARPMVDLSLTNLATQRRYHCHSHERIGNDLKLVFTPLYAN
jgi:diaminohydroxyphosphoribosylaminopyrimidine deaminase/5-amino-6-(5-phosphoribosylamino)uracil reductase